MRTKGIFILLAMLLAACGPTKTSSSVSTQSSIFSETSSIVESTSSSSQSSEEKTSSSSSESSSSTSETTSSSSSSEIISSSSTEESSSSSSEETSSSSSKTSSSSSVSSSSSSSSSSQENSSEVSSESSSSSSEVPEFNEDALNPFDESKFNEQTYLHHIGNVFEAWKSYRGRGITIAVIDSGFDITHEEFKYPSGNSKISSKSALFSTDLGKTTTTVGVENVNITDGDSHGTFCAGVAAGSTTGTGITGIAPDAELLLLKTDKKPLSIAEAFKYAADNGARVITISIGSYYDYVGDLVNDGSDLSTVFDESLQYAYDKGVVICSAGGNGGEMGIPTDYTFPGACNNVIGVGGLAFNSSDRLWEGTSYNSSAEYQFIDIVAPAHNLTGACNYSGKKYDSGWNGTSFASPMVAGAAALYFEKNPTATNKDFERDLYATAAPVSGTSHIGAGRLDIGALLDVNVETTITINFEGADWWNQDSATTSLYLWNSITGKTATAWPGTVMNENSFEVSLKDYDSVIFTRTSANGDYWNAKTLDLSLHAFLTYSTYSISKSNATWENSSGPVLAGYFK